MRSTGKNINATINDHALSYNDEGSADAKAIIFIHGFPFNKSMWDEQANALKNDYRVISYDIRGHGNSELSSADYNIDLFVNDLTCLMDALHLESTILCGLSMGGYIALKAMEKHPERFEALILCDTQCKADSAEAREKRLLTIENVSIDGVEKFAEDSIKNLFASESISTKKEVVAMVSEMILNTSKESICKTLHALADRTETCSNLYKIDIPVLILVGEEDKITTPDAAKLMHEKISHSKLKVIAQAGHLSNLEQPIEFNKHLKGFYAGAY